MLAFFLHCSIEDHVFVVELLSQHKIKLEVSIPPKTNSNIYIDDCLIRIDKPVFMLTFLDTFLKHHP